MNQKIRCLFSNEVFTEHQLFFLSLAKIILV
jgi:hypothetical protein